MEVSLNLMQRDGTVPLDETFTEVIEHHGRTYQHYALMNGTYFVPIDEVQNMIDYIPNPWT